jgi:hypothetical protein
MESSSRLGCSAIGWSPWRLATDPERRHLRRSVANQRLRELVISGELGDIGRSILS